MQRFRTGIVGSGFGVTTHLPAFRNHPRFEVVALASPTRATTLAKEHDVSQSFASCAQMLEGCELDVVAVASPPFAHYDDVMAALRARKHVLCEKPLAHSVAQAEAMCTAADAAGTVCAINHEFRFVPEIAALKELVVNGHLGELRQIEVSHFRTRLRREELRPRGWWFDRAKGGGITGAVMSHLIDQANWLAGVGPRRIAGFGRTANPQRRDDNGTFETGIDDGVFALLAYPDGLVARLCVDATLAVDSHLSAVHGDRRSAVASGPDIVDLSLYTADASETDELNCKPSPYAQFERFNGNVPLLMELLDEFARAIDGEPADLPTFTDGVATQRVLAAIGYGD